MNSIAPDSGVRQAGADDFLEVMRLYRQLQPDDPVLEDGADRIAFDAILAAPHLHLFVLERETGLASTCYLNIIPNITRRASPYGVIENVVTDTTFRRSGLGRAVMEHALGFAWDRRCYKVMLMTGSKREATHNFYKSCGFKADEKFAFLARPPS